MKRILFLVILLNLACQSVQKKTSDEQLQKNNAAIELNKNAVDAIDKSDLTKQEKQEIKSALWNSSGTISESSAKIKQLEEEAKKEFEIKSRLIAENTTIKPLKVLISKLILTIIILSAIIILFLIVPFVRKILYKLSPAGKVLEEAKKEIEDEMQIIKDKLK